MEKIYHKVDGEYIPVVISDEFRYGLEPGAHLVVVGDGFDTTVRNIDVEAAPILAALRIFSEELMNNVVEYGKLQPKNTPHSDEQVQAIEHALSLIAPEHQLLFPSPAEVVNKSLGAIEDQLIVSINDPNVKDIYDKFVTCIGLMRNV